MNLYDYQKLAQRTEKPLPQKDALAHGIIGLITEVGELGDPLKKHIIYNAPLDKENVQEELGDILWYMAVVANALGINLSLAAAENIEKLQKRYPEAYSDKDAMERKDKS